MAASLTNRGGRAVRTAHARGRAFGSRVPSSAAPPELDGLATELLTAMRALEAALKRHPARKAVTSRAATTAECEVLRCLLRASGPLSLAELARGVHRDPSSVSVLAHQLAERRLVRKQRDSHDRRRLRIVVTPEGRRAVREAPDVTRAALASVVATWPAERIRAATDLLTGLTTALPTQR